MHETEVNEANPNDDIHLAEIEAQKNETMMEVNEEQDSIILDEENNAESDINEDFFDTEDDVSHDDNTSSEEREEYDLVLTRNLRDETHHDETNSVHELTATNPYSARENIVGQETETDTTGVGMIRSVRPRRAAAGRGLERLEPAIGGKEHVSYKMKLGLLQKAREMQTHRTRVCLMMREVRRKHKGGYQLMQVMANIMFLSAQMSAKQGFKKYGERAVMVMLKEFEQLNKGVLRANQ